MHVPVMTESALKNALNKGDILPVYILFGDDSYLINRYENIIIEKTCGRSNEFDLQKFERDVDLQSVYDSVNQFSFTGARRCTVLSDYNFEAAGEKDFERLLSLVSDSYDTSTLVLRFDGIEFDEKHSAKAKILLNACEKGGGSAVLLNHRTSAELSKMLQVGAKKRGKLLDKTTADFMIQNCGLDINTLVSELDKVCRFVSRDTVSKEDINLVCTKTVEASVYEYAKKIIVCDTRMAMKMLNDLFYMRFEPMLILYSVASVFVDMARVNAALKMHIPLAGVAVDFPYKNKEFVLRNASYNLKRLNDKKLNLCFTEILSADKLLKSFSADDKLILEQMTVKLIYIIAHGEAVD